MLCIESIFEIRTKNLSHENTYRKYPQLCVPSLERCYFPKLFGNCELLCYLFHETVHRIPTSCFNGLWLHHWSTCISSYYHLHSELQWSIQWNYIARMWLSWDVRSFFLTLIDGIKNSYVNLLPYNQENQTYLILNFAIVLWQDFFSGIRVKSIIQVVVT